MADRGRKPGFEMGEEHRTKIRNSKILSRLISHVEGDCDMTATQVSAGLGLLRKVMPDLASVDATVEHNVSDPLGELLKAIADRGQRIHDR